MSWNSFFFLQIIVYIQKSSADITDIECDDFSKGDA